MLLKKAQAVLMKLEVLHCWKSEGENSTQFLEE